MAPDANFAASPVLLIQDHQVFEGALALALALAGPGPGNIFYIFLDVNRSVHYLAIGSNVCANGIACCLSKLCNQSFTK